MAQVELDPAQAVPMPECIIPAVPRNDYTAEETSEIMTKFSGYWCKIENWQSSQGGDVWRQIWLYDIQAGGCYNCVLIGEGKTYKEAIAAAKKWILDKRVEKA